MPLLADASDIGSDIAVICISILAVILVVAWAVVAFGVPSSRKFTGRLMMNRRQALPNQALQRSAAGRAAKFSIAAPFAMLAIGAVSSISILSPHVVLTAILGNAPIVNIAVDAADAFGLDPERVTNHIVGSTGLLLLPVGFVLGIIALVQTKRHGKHGIFGKAIAGLIINGFFIAWFFIQHSKIERLREMRMQRLQQQQP
jgi:hypothetical protein